MRIFLRTCAIVGILWLLGLYGREDYNAAVVSAQISNEAQQNRP